MELNLVREITGKMPEEGLRFLLKEYIERKITDYKAEINEFLGIRQENKRERFFYEV